MQAAMAASLRDDAERTQRYADARQAMQQQIDDHRLAFRLVFVPADGRCLYAALIAALREANVLQYTCASRRIPTRCPVGMTP